MSGKSRLLTNRGGGWPKYLLFFFSALRCVLPLSQKSNHCDGSLLIYVAMLTFITGRERSRVRWVPSRLGSQYAGSHGSKKYSSDLSGSTDFHGVRGTRSNIAAPDGSIRLRESARFDAGRILLTWGICTRRAGKCYRAHSRLVGWLVDRTILKTEGTGRVRKDK